MAQYHEQTRPGLGIPGAVGTSELTTVQYASGSGTTETSDLTVVQPMIGSKIETCGGCGVRKDWSKGKKRKYESDSQLGEYLKLMRTNNGNAIPLPPNGFVC